MEWYLAEDLAPWGESAANVRMESIIAAIQAASDGYTKESREAAQGWLSRLRLKLFGPRPAKPPPKASALRRS